MKQLNSKARKPKYIVLKSRLPLSTPPHFLLKNIFKGTFSKGNIIVGAIRKETKHHRNYNDAVQQ